MRVTSVGVPQGTRHMAVPRTGAKGRTGSERVAAGRMTIATGGVGPAPVLTTSGRGTSQDEDAADHVTTIETGEARHHDHVQVVRMTNIPNPVRHLG